jgi:HPt (histidine-containing phosphotransfer) domain-containing protein
MRRRPTPTEVGPTALTPSVPGEPTLGENIKVLDSTRLQALRKLGGASDSDVIDDLIGLFRSDAPMRLSDLRAALAKQDSLAMQHTAHSFKSTSATLGGQRLAALCQELENRGARAALAGSESVLVSVEREYQLLCEALENYRRR